MAQRVVFRGTQVIASFDRFRGGDMAAVELGLPSSLSAVVETLRWVVFAFLEDADLPSYEDRISYCMENDNGVVVLLQCWSDARERQESAFSLLQLAREVHGAFLPGTEDDFVVPLGLQPYGHLTDKLKDDMQVRWSDEKLVRLQTYFMFSALLLMRQHVVDNNGDPSLIRAGLQGDAPYWEHVYAFLSEALVGGLSMFFNEPLPWCSGPQAVADAALKRIGTLS